MEPIAIFVSVVITSLERQGKAFFYHSEYPTYESQDKGRPEQSVNSEIFDYPKPKV